MFVRNVFFLNLNLCIEFFWLMVLFMKMEDLFCLFEYIFEFLKLLGYIMFDFIL